MDRDAFSHIRLWCPRPFGTYSQNKLCRSGRADLFKGGGGGPDAAACTPTDVDMREGAQEGAVSENTPPASEPPAAPPDSQVEDGRVLLDTWYVIKPGNTKEKIAFFVAHQCSSGGLLRPNAMKMKGRWGSDCTKAKRRRRCSNTPPGPAPAPAPETDNALGLSETDLLSVAQMVALVEQRTAMALQGIMVQGAPPPSPQTVLPDPDALSLPPEPPSPSSRPPSPCEVEQPDSWRVAEAVAHFEAQQRLEGGLLQPGGGESERGGDAAGGSGEVRIAFRVSSMDPCSQAKPTGRPSCMFLSRGGGGTQPGARAKEKITCDLYQLLSPSSRDPGTLLAKPETGGEGPPAVSASAPTCDPEQDRGAGEQVSGFHVEVVVTGAVDQCVFYGKDGSEKVQEETVCFSPADACEDPPPGQLFFLQSPRPEEERHGPADPPGGACDRATSPVLGTGQEQDRPDPPLCRLYRHVSHDFLEIRFQIQRLLEPRQYLLLLPDHIMVTIFSYLPTRSLAALKCTCHDFKALIETYGVRATDSRWNQDPLYRDDPCKQCKRQYARGDVSLCRWHPKPYHHDLPYGRSYWMCCRRADKDTPGCRVGLHDNNWVQPCDLVQNRCKRDDLRPATDSM